MTALDTFNVGAYRVEIFQDDTDDGPREWDNLGTMACKYRGYDLGDSDASSILDQYLDRNDYADEGEEDARGIAQWLRDEHGATVVLPLFLYDHSGLSMSAGGNLLADADTLDSRGRFVGDSAGWDTSSVGVIFDTPESRELCGTAPEYIETALRAEVETYDQFLRGDVYGYRVSRPVKWVKADTRSDGWVDDDEILTTWEEVDACWGFYGFDEVKTEARGVAEYLPTNPREVFAQ